MVSWQKFPGSKQGPECPPAIAQMDFVGVAESHRGWNGVADRPQKSTGGRPPVFLTPSINHNVLQQSVSTYCMCCVGNANDPPQGAAGLQNANKRADP